MSFTNKSSIINPLYKDDPIINHIKYAKENGAKAHENLSYTIDPIRSENDLFRIDHIDFTKFTKEEKYSFLDTNINIYMDDYHNNREISDHHFFKDFMLMENVDDIGAEDNIRYWRYHIDDNYLVLETFTKDPVMSTLTFEYGFKMLIDNYPLVWIISTHVLEEYDTNRKTFNNESFYILSQLGLHFMLCSEYASEILPISVYKDRFNPDLYYPIDKFTNYRKFNQIKQSVINFFASGIGRFVSINNYLLRSVEENEQIIILDNDEKKKAYINEYIESPDPISDKLVIVDIGKLSTHIGSSNINIFKSAIKRSYKYKFQVRGHKHHYWVGSGVNKHLEERWVDSYYKNKDKPFKIIKEIEDSSQE